jgi:hypothetical protein
MHASKELLHTTECQLLTVKEKRETENYYQAHTTLTTIMGKIYQ